MIKIHKDNRGFVLLWSLAMSVVVASIGLALLGSAIMVTNSASSTLQKDMTQIEAENLSRIAFNLMKSTLQENSDLTSDQLTVILNDKLVSILKPGYSINNFSVNIDPNLFISQIPGGPFRGLQSQNRALTMDLVLYHNPSRTTAKFDLSAYLGNIYPTQFNFFSFADLQNLNAIRSVNTSGRIFANDFAYIGNYGGYSPFTMDFFATAGNFYNIPGWNTRVAKVQNPSASTDYVIVPDPIDNNCTNCSGSGLGFYKWASNTWNGQFQDSHFGVQRLDYWFGNDTFLNIPRISSPPGELVKYQLAYQADIRIINGVWYLKNPNSVSQWPGLPIWSDHPGSMTAWNENDHEGSQAVGQDDIAANLTALALSTAWPAGTMPQKFSYYKVNPATGAIDTANFQGIVSYGNLQNTTTTGAGNWLPGDFVGDPLCNAGFTCQNCGGGGVVKTKSIANFTPQCANALGVAGLSPNRGARLLNATRSGFKFGFANYIATNHASTSKIWPMNFDLVQFQNALTCGAGHPGELGCYFGAGKYMGREFNGIVYINNTWKNQLQKTQYPFMQNDAQVDAVFAGATNNDPWQPAVTRGGSGPIQNQILPMQLCSDSQKGLGFDSPLGTNLFKIPDCAKYKDHSTFAARTNALRVINGGIDPTKFTKGLTIYSPVQIYATGDLNPNSDVTTVTSTPWMPLFLASASIIPLSNAWDDSNAPWDQSPGAIYRQARNTKQIMTATYGHDTGPDFDEVWSGTQYEKRGGNIVFPTLLGADDYSNFYWREDPNIQVVYLGPGVFVNPDTMNYLEDPHYQVYNNQPAGMMPVNVVSINSWIKKTRETASTGP